MSYSTRPLKFTDFTTEQNFKVLKTKYGLSSYTPLSEMELEQLESEPDFKIEMLDIDDYDIVIGTVYRSFVSDFLYLNIPNIAKLNY